MTDVLTSKKTKTPWLPYQRAWMNDDAPLKVGEKSRRIGWTYIESYDCVSRRFRTDDRRNQDYWFSSADESAAAEFIEYCKFWAGAYTKVVDYFTEQVEDSKTHRPGTLFCIRCPNGKRITAMSSNPRRFRSKGGDVTLDEFGYHDDARGMYKAAKPSTMRGGWTRIFSTHNGEESEFNTGFVSPGHQILRALGYDPLHFDPTKIAYDQVRQAARKLKVKPVKLHRVTLLDAVEQGLVENINHFSNTSLTREDFVEDCRATCTDEDMWNEEFMCVPSVGTSALLPYEMIEKCERDECKDAIEGLSRHMGNGPKFIGMDFGRRKHNTVIWLLEQVGSRKVTRGVRWLHDAKFETQLDALGEWMRIPGVIRAVLDQTGMGEMPVEIAKKRYGQFRVEGVLFSGHNPQNLAMPLRGAFEDVSIDIPEDRRIREGLHKVRRIVTTTGNVRFNAEQDELGHADEFWALAMANHAGSDGGTAWNGECVGSNGNSEEEDQKHEYESELPTAL